MDDGEKNKKEDVVNTDSNTEAKPEPLSPEEEERRRYMKEFTDSLCRNGLDCYF